jgi:hypothetical protein
MKNAIKVVGIIAMLAVIGLISSCEVDPEDQVMITITGIPAAFNDSYAMVLLCNSQDGGDAVAGSFYKRITGGQVSNVEMLDAKDTKKAFGKNGNYHVALDINSAQNGEGSDLYTGITTSKKSVVKGENTYNTELFYPDIIDYAGAPSLNNFGIYTTTYSGITETIELSATSFYIKDDSNGAGNTPDDLTFTITSWEEATPPAAIAATYPKAYKFGGKITAASSDGDDYIPSPKTAPGFADSDINVTTCYMYIYFNGETGSITFVRTAFTKSATVVPDVVTGSDSANRVYTKN